jgi:hypothetical protein
MIEKTTTVQYVKVTNRNNGYTGYTLTNGQKRLFSIGETKQISIDELKELSQIDGGEYMLRNYLIVDDKSALDFLNIDPEPEYYYTEKEIKVLLEQGTLDQLEDALNFAPQGVIDLIKDISIKIELPDTRKRKMIFDKTGFSVDNAITVNKIVNADTEEAPAAAEVKRKAAPIQKQDEAPVRKSKYTVVSK